MSSRKDKSRDKSQNNSAGGWAAVLAGVAGAAIIAGASAYGGYKLRQREEEKKRKQKAVSSDKQFLAEEERDRGWEELPGAAVDATETCRFKSENSGGVDSLHDRLLAYYHHYASVPPRQRSEAEHVVDTLRIAIDDQLTGHNVTYKWCFMTLRPVGSHQENTQVIRPDNFDFNVIFDMGRTCWTLVDCGTEGHMPRMSGRWLITRVNKVNCRHTHFDSHMVNDYLSPTLISSALAKALDEDRLSGSKHKVRLCRQDDHVILTVCYGEDKILYVNLYPATRLYESSSGLEKEIEVVPWEVPWWLKYEQSEYLPYWRRCHDDEERRLVSDTVPRQCLQIMKAIRLNDPQLGLLNTYIYKNLLYHCLQQEDEWRQETLAERFLDLIKMLEGFLCRKHVPHFFEPGMNLLEGIDDTSLEGIVQYLGRLLGQQQLSTLLQERL